MTEYLIVKLIVATEDEGFDSRIYEEVRGVEKTVTHYVIDFEEPEKESEAIEKDKVKSFIAVADTDDSMLEGFRAEAEE